MDHIIIYQNHCDLSYKDIDNTLVHEMIHQYIIQNDLDTRPHGKIFKAFMKRINEAFRDELNITVTAPYRNVRGPGLSMHKLVLIRKENNVCYCCKINPNKVETFKRELDKNQVKWHIQDYLFCESMDKYFDSFSTCRERLHGKRMSLSQLKALCGECKIRLA